MNTLLSNDPGWEKKVWRICAIITFFIILTVFLKQTFNVLLLIFAGVLIALYFRGLSGLLQQKTGMNKKWALPLSILVSILLLLLFFWLAGARIQRQAAELSQTLPATVERFKAQLSTTTIGQRIVEQASGTDSMSKASTFVSTFFRSTFGVLGDIYVVLFLGIFFTAAPKTYREGIIRIVPPPGREKAAMLLQRISETLTKWLKGALFAMLIVSVLTWIGLVSIGMPMAVVLALIAGLLNFIPNFGPLIAMIPAVLIGLMQGTTTALLVVGLYLLVQMIESNLITPQIQKRMINMPPALIIIAQLFMGLLSGGWGVVLATPLTAMIIVVVRTLYIEPQEEKTGGGEQQVTASK